MVATATESLLAVADIEALTPARLRCGNPECGEFCLWRGGRGRPSEFCSKRCRDQFTAKHEWLLKSHGELEEALTNDLTYRQRRSVEASLAKLRWALRMYSHDS